jgi:hypothetical protein
VNESVRIDVISGVTKHNEVKKDEKRVSDAMKDLVVIVKKNSKMYIV